MNKSRTQPNSRAQKKATPSTRKSRQTTTSVPFVQSVQVTQSAPLERVIRETGSDIIGTLSIDPTTKPGEIVAFSINPARLFGTRLNSLLANYQKYRFVRGSRFQIVTNQPSTVGGSIVVGFTSNPDMEITEGQISSIYALPGAQIAPMFVPVNVGMSVPSSKWLNFDIDSDEVMMTTAGLLFIGLQSQVNITGSTQIPIVLHWTVEMTGAATQSGGNTAKIIIPAPITMTSVDSSYNVYLKSGPNPVPTLIPSKPYLMNPSMTFHTGGSGGNPSEVIAVFCTQGATSGGNSYRFYSTYEQYQQDERLKIIMESGFVENGITLTPLN